MSHRKLAQNNFAYLLGGLLFFFLLIPSLHLFLRTSMEAELLRDYLPVGFSLFILIGVWGLQGNRRFFHLGLVLALLQVALAVVEQFTHIAAIKVGAALNVLAFCVLNAFLAAQHVFSWRQVDANTLIGAVCVYLLLGLIWAVIYTMFAYFWPEGSFNGLTFQKNAMQFENFLYYSFVTLTTAGYGDITPVNPLLRTLAYLEMIVGQFYMAILVAGLVGLFMGKRGATGSGNGP
ncbi:MAG TPA: ion channel [Methylococcaceae bacterium]|nr:ion channel [Methylococcaceae bacterium]